MTLYDFLSDQEKARLALADHAGLKSLPDYLQTADRQALSWGVATKAEQVDEKGMACDICVSTERVDRSRDIVVAKGVDFADHSMNPMVLLEHSRYAPVGKALSPSREYTVKNVGDRIVARTYFDQSSLLGSQAFEAVAKGMLNGGSMGFLAKSADVVPTFDDPANPRSGVTWTVQKCSLVEYSHVLFPDNPEALVIGYQKGLGGKPLEPQLKAAFEPHVSRFLAKSGPVVTSGWVPPPQPASPPAPPAAKPEVKEKETDWDELYDGPAGAKAVQKYYDLLAFAGVEVLKAVDSQESPVVGEFLTEKLAAIDHQLAEVAAFFKTTFPRLKALPEELGVPAELDAGDTADPYLTLKSRVGTIAKKMPKGYRLRTKKCMKFLKTASEHTGEWGDSHRAEAKSCHALMKAMIDPEDGDEDDEKTLKRLADKVGEYEEVIKTLREEQKMLRMGHRRGFTLQDG